MKAGVNEKVAMKISGHKTRDVFDRNHIVDTEDVVAAMRRVQDAPGNLVQNGGNTVKFTPQRRPRKQLNP
jgi:hypothetical protein